MFVMFRRKCDNGFRAVLCMVCDRLFSMILELIFLIGKLIFSFHKVLLVSISDVETCCLVF